MSGYYYDDPFGQTYRRRTNVPLYPQAAESSSRRVVPPAPPSPPPRNFSYQTTFQPAQDRYRPPPPVPQSRSYRHSDFYPNERDYADRSATNRSSVRNRSSNEETNERPVHRRYQLEQPSTRSYTRQEPSSDRHHPKRERPMATNTASRYEEEYPRYDRRPQQREDHRSSYPTPRSFEPQPTRQTSNPMRSGHQHQQHSSSSTPRVPAPIVPPVDRTLMPMAFPHPAFLLSNILQQMFNDHSPFIGDDDDDDDPRASVTPPELLAFALMMPGRSVLAFPGALHIQFGNLLDLLPHEEPASVGLSEEDIERIPTMTYRKSSRSTGNDEKCAICLSEYKTGEKVKRLRCKHIFHIDCIDPWLKTSTQCPICRDDQSK